MMTKSPNLQPGLINRTNKELQAELYKFVQRADETYNFPNGLDVYYQLLNTLNKYIP